ncbi:MAG TPA: heterodisulfide reductase-related iron-sulfur binding cluster [Methylomirabilota bacterium]|nr:heterodisulfide reductase-related iron-sulfur binding cluster [Methylomirabilota bacterium]
MSESGNISYRPTDGLSYDPAEPVYWDAAALDRELVRTFEICHGCRLCFKFCDTFPDLFRLIDQRHDGDVRRITAAERQAVLDTCFQCKLCEVNCPYTVRDRHEYQLDFPRLVHRFRAQRARARGVPLRDRVLADPDRAGALARASLGLASAANRTAAHRWLLEKVAGIHRDKLLPDFAGQSFEAWARRAGHVRAEPGGEVVLFQTCYVQHNEPAIGRDTLEVLQRNGVDVRCAAGLRCCGMPAWEKGDLDALRAQARDNLAVLGPFVERGARVVAINPTCSMLLRREYPELVAPEDRAAARRVAEATRDPAEFLWSIREEPRFNTAFRSAPDGPVAYHAPCHLRAQAIGFRARDLLRKIPGVRPAMVAECCGHDGTYAMTVEGFEPSQRIGRNAFEGMREAQASVWATDCPLAALQFAQHAGVKPLHPMTILARAYREDGFPRRLPPPGDPAEPRTP